MAPLAGHLPGHGDGRSTRLHHPHDDPWGEVRGENQHAVPVPRATTAMRRIGKFPSFPAFQIDPLQLAVGKKPNRPAIWCPERITGSFGARERPGCHLIERPHPKLRHTFGGGDERQLSAVGRQRERYRIIGRRRRNFEARKYRLGNRSTEVQRGRD